MDETIPIAIGTRILTNVIPCRCQGTCNQIIEILFRTSDQIILFRCLVQCSHQTLAIAENIVERTLCLETGGSMILEHTYQSDILFLKGNTTHHEDTSTDVFTSICRMTPHFSHVACPSTKRMTASLQDGQWELATTESVLPRTP
jgi:hypothetical protein